MKIQTVGDFLDSGTGLGVHCLNLKCRHYARVDLLALAESRGRDFMVTGADSSFLKAARCSKCGGTSIQMTVIAGGAPMGRGPLPK